MTAGEAIRMADAMRPNNEFDVDLKQVWLRDVDARLRNKVVAHSRTDGALDDVGADKAWSSGGLESGTELLVPEAYTALYPHWLCAQMDLALGETERATNELQLYTDSAEEFAVWMRQHYLPTGAVQFRY